MEKIVLVGILEFSLNIISSGLIICHMLPYLLLNFDSPTQLCIDISSAVAKYCKAAAEKADPKTSDHPLNHLATVKQSFKRIS